MLAVSTSWKSKDITDGAAFVALLESFDIDGIELEYRIDEALFSQMQAALKRSHIKVVSIHNYFPIPAGRPGSGGSGDLFLLSHPDKDQRHQAIRMTLRTMQYAHELGAQAVVLHCGRVEMDPELGVLHHYWDAGQMHSKEARAFIARKRMERDTLKPPHLESLLFSLDKLAPMAEKQNLVLGLENRYHYHELPGFDDFEMLFKAFGGGPLGYWHDTGHAHANEELTIIPPQALLNAYSNRLAGVHLHDATGLDDHLAPGTGAIDFQKLKPFIQANARLVIELKSGTPDADVSRGIRYVRKRFMGQGRGEV